jgi:hypothetical protein
VPTRRVWRYKPRVEPLTPTEWAFFMVRDKEGFDRIWEKHDGGGLFFLYYADTNGARCTPHIVKK